MRLKQDRRLPDLKRFIVVQILLFSILLFFVSIGAFFAFRGFKLDAELEISRENLYRERKEIIKREIENIFDYIDYFRTFRLHELKNHLPQRVIEAVAVTRNIAKVSGGNYASPTVRVMAAEALRPIRFNGKRGYFFILDTDGTILLFPDHPEYEGQNLIDWTDPLGTKTVAEIIDFAQTNGDGFYEYLWTKPGTEGDTHKKISYLYLDPAFGWIIGAGDYIDNMEQDVQEGVIARISEIRYGDGGYIFVVARDGTTLVNSGQPGMRGVNLKGFKDSDGADVFSLEIAAANTPDGDFITYKWPPPGSNTEGRKLSFVRGYNDWGWIIGTGVYVDDIETLLENTRKEFISSWLLESAVLFVLFSLFFSVLTSVVLVFLGKIDRQISKLIVDMRMAAEHGSRIPVAEFTLRELSEIASKTDKMFADLRAAADENKKTTDALEKEKRSLEKAVTDKNMLLRELHHRVKNNLQIVVSLLNLQKDAFDPSKALDALDDSIARISSMSSVHETLYLAGEYASLPLAEFVRNLSKGISTAFSDGRDIDVTIRTNGNPSFDIETMVPLALLFNELLMNSYKHAFRSESKGRIDIDINEQQNGSTTIVYEDSGSGFQTGDAKSTKTIGLGIVDALVRQLRGHMDMPKPGSSRYEIELPPRNRF